MTRSRLTSTVLAALVLAVPAVAGGAAPATAGPTMLGANQVTTATGNVDLLGTRGHRLVLQHCVSCDGGAVVRDAITHLDPRTGHNRVIAELPSNEQYGPVLAYGERRALLG